ncbi:Flagellin hook IN motif-containing protein [Neorhodopirellula lusitana]|uniref:Flagellin hook IN motif-containing protein n=1 Tax=Neorhodopirellula lusitana TaxID=445327 RepID=A0ABY1PP04_9BACT|nr:flagellin hook IN motif-containing protein [Neorhodopirellula lusitana]SMP37886.1 Flagellin hook IN motif-containing protein [Neorhodopirellula lusitana]
MSISSVSGANSSGGLLIERFSSAVRGSSTTQTSVAEQATSSTPSLDRITRLIEKLKEQSLNAARTNQVERLDSFQSTIDEALSEIGFLAGVEFSAGGVDQAVVTGAEASQLKDVQVLGLPPGAEASFSGAVVRKSAGASTTVDNIGRLLSGGGSLQLNSGGDSRTIYVNKGGSFGGLVRSINDGGYGVQASEIDNRLRLTSRSTGPSSSLEVISRARRTVRGPEGLQVSGLNAAQIANVAADGLDPNQSITVSGSRDSVATTAELTYQGDAEGRVSGTATFQLNGDQGSQTFSATKGESLEDLAARISAASDQTGVIATVDGDQLRLTSLAKGDDASVSITDISAVQETSVSGVDPDEFSRFDLVSMPADTQVTVSGSITQAAETANLTYRGAVGSEVVETATFTLSGANGSAEVNVTQGESLADVADRINASSSSTGVLARVDGDDLQFESSDVGSAQSVSVTLDRITQDISVTGVDPAKIENFTVESAEHRSSNTLSGSIDQAATKAQLTSNSYGVSSSSATFSLTGELGSETFSVSWLQSLSSLRNDINDATDRTGVVASIESGRLKLTSSEYGSDAIVELDVLSGSFGTSGGDGNGNAQGTDAELTINGNAVTADRNHVAYSDSLGSYSFDLVADQSGALADITIDSTDRDFDIEGGDGDGNASGLDAVATLNGVEYTGTGNRFEETIDSAQLDFEVTQGFVGAINPVTVESKAAEFSISGGDGNGEASGQNGTATIDGVSFSSATDTFEAIVDGESVQIQFASNFTGTFDDLTLTGGDFVANRSAGSQTYRASGRSQYVEINGERLYEQAGRYLAEQNGVQISFALDASASGTIGPITVTGTKSESSDSYLPVLEGQQQLAVQSVLPSLFQLASGGAYSGDAYAPSQTLSVLIEALDQLQGLSGQSSRQGRSLQGFALDVSA